MLKLFAYRKEYQEIYFLVVLNFDWTGSSSFVFIFQWYCLAAHGPPTVKQHVLSIKSSSLLLYSSINL